MACVLLPLEKEKSVFIASVAVVVCADPRDTMLLTVFEIPRRPIATHRRSDSFSHCIVWMMLQHFNNRHRLACPVFNQPFISLNLLVSVSLPWFGTPLAFTQYESWAL
jgi:hypothetical protein